MAPAACVVATYRIRVAAAEIDRIARFVAYEQTVELPEALVTDAHLLEDIVGRVLAIEAADDGAFMVRVAFNAELASGQLSQLINLVYGNVSMYPGIRLEAIELPPVLLERFAGPGYGVDGLRALLGVHGRPLLSTAVKPRGLPVARLAQLAHEFALGGGDIVKDDQNLVDGSFADFSARIDACASAVERANAATGRNCLYFPHLSAPHEDLDRYARAVRERGLRGVLLCPSVLGYDTARDLAARHQLVYMAHPALSGVLLQSGDGGMSHAVALGTLLRLGGADISVFVAPGGRFRYTQAQCMSIADAGRASLGRIAPLWPSPAGGMDLDKIGDLCARYGRDTVLLVGGAMQAYSSDFTRGTRAFLDEIVRHCGERLVEPVR